MSARLGRPPLPKGNRRSSTVTLRMSKAHRHMIGEAAGKQKLSAWIRDTLLRAAQRPTVETKPPQSSRPSVWERWEGGRVVFRIETPEPMPRDLWERLRRYVDVIKPEA